MAAEYGAHLTGTSPFIPRPSIFEVLAQENLSDALRPAFKHVFKVLADKNPVRFSLLYHLNDEIYLVFKTWLEYLHLQKYGASFAENFYSLCRVSESSPKLPGHVKWRSLFFLTMVPYLKLKGNNLYEKLEQTEDYQNNTSHQSIHVRLCKAYLAVYPFIHGLFEASLFICQLLYVFTKLDFHSWFLLAAGVRLTWQREDVHQSKNLEINTPNGFLNKLLEGLLSTKDVLISTVTSSLTTGVFFLQFLDWWYSSDTTPTLNSLPIPAPPSKEVGSNIPSTLCPLCHRTRTNDTALSVSGYVFCYPCVYKYVMSHRRCPITGYPAETSHLIRIYSDDT